jgi:hypothetical protein
MKLAKTSLLRSPVFFFYLLIGFLVLAMGYSRLVRQLSLARELRYIPRENVLLLATGDIDSLWRSAESQVREILDAPEDSGILAAARNRQQVADEDFPVKSPCDLQRYGIDTGRGLLLSLSSFDNKNGYILVVPLRDVQRFHRFLKKTSGKKPSKRTLTGPRSGERYDVTAFGDLLVALPEPGLAIVSESEPLLRRSLLLQRENWDHASGDDVLFTAIRRVLRRPMMQGPTIFLFARDVGKSLQGSKGVLGDAAVAVEISQDVLRIRGDVKIANGALKSIDDLLQQSRGVSEWRSRVPSDTAILLSLQSGALGQVLRLLPETNGVEGNSFGELTNALRETSGLRQLVVGVTGYQQGLPKVIVGAWGIEKELERLVFRVQKSLRIQRDRNLVQNALAKAAEEQCLKVSMTTEDLRTMDLLKPEAFSLLDRYPISADMKVKDALLEEQDFHNAGYERKYQGLTLRYLAPPVVENDLLYTSFETSEAKAAFKSERYRMASLTRGDVLWIATEARMLEELIDQQRGRTKRPSLEGNKIFQRAVRNWRDTDKFEAFLNIRRTVTLGLLSPEGAQGEDDRLRRVLLDFRHHSSFSVQLNPLSDKNRVSLTVELMRPAGDS